MHKSPALQVPHESIFAPQPSAAGPHSRFCAAHVVGVQLCVPLPHLFGTGGLPTPQASPVGHTPHEISPPQPSAAKPQSSPAGQVVAGTHAVLGGTHEPRSKIMNSSNFSWEFIGFVSHCLGNTLPCSLAS